MEARRPPPEIQALEDQARLLLEEARRRSGASVDKIVKTLGQFQPRRAETRRSWYDWHEKPETVSLLTGLAAIQMLGPEVATELLFGAQNKATASAAMDLDDLRGELADTVTQLAQLRERVDSLVVPELEKQAKLITEILGSMKDDGISSGTDHARAQTGT